MATSSRAVRRTLGLVDRMLMRRLPPRLGLRARVGLLRKLGAQIETPVVIGPGVTVLAPEHLVMRRGSSVARDVLLDARGGLTLQEDVLIGFESVLLTSTHNSDQLGVPIQRQGMYERAIVVGPRAWLGARVFLLPGVELGEDSIVATNSVVTRDVESRTIVAGSPAKKLRTR